MADVHTSQSKRNFFQYKYIKLLGQGWSMSRSSVYSCSLKKWFLIRFEVNTCPSRCWPSVGENRKQK